MHDHYHDSHEALHSSGAPCSGQGAMGTTTPTPTPTPTPQRTITTPRSTLPPVYTCCDAFYVGQGVAIEQVEGLLRAHTTGRHVLRPHHLSHAVLSHRAMVAALAACNAHRHSRLSDVECAESEALSILAQADQS